MSVTSGDFRNKVTMIGAAKIVDVQGIMHVAVNVTVQKRDGKIMREVLLKRLRVDVGRHNHETVNPPPHHPERSFDLFLVVVGARNDKMILVLLSGLIGTTDDLREKFTKQIGEK